MPIDRSRSVLYQNFEAYGEFFKCKRCGQVFRQRVCYRHLEGSHGCSGPPPLDDGHGPPEARLANYPRFSSIHAAYKSFAINISSYAGAFLRST
jgi:hypothetical protein